jgi:hypothetical protein
MAYGCSKYKKYSYNTHKSTKTTCRLLYRMQMERKTRIRERTEQGEQKKVARKENRKTDMFVHRRRNFAREWKVAKRVTRDVKSSEKFCGNRR